MPGVRVNAEARSCRDIFQTERTVDLPFIILHEHQKSKATKSAAMRREESVRMIL